MLEKNPFNQLIAQIKDISMSNITENKIFNIGIVTSPLPDLKIKTSGIELDSDNLYIDKWLLDRHEETETYTEGTHTHSGDDHAHSGGEHTHKSKDYQNKLEVGDKVIMFREGDMFFIISKVVRING